MSDDISLSVEETNKLRISLGLAPLDLEPKITDKAHDNYTRSRTESAAQKQKDEALARADEARKAQEREHTFSAAPLADSSISNALTWVEQNRKRLKESARTANKPQPSTTSDSAQYSSHDLRGLKVVHDVADIASGGEQILTLQDKSIDELEDGSGIELQSIALAEAQRAREIANNKRKTTYDGWSPTGNGSGMLSHYDEVLGESQNSASFTISEGGVVAHESDAAREQHEIRKKLGQHVETLDITHTNTVSDFYTESEAAALFRKPKKPSKKKDKKSKRSARAKKSSSIVNDLDIPAAADENVENDGPEDADVVELLTKRTRIDDSNFIDDDDDLQNAIASVRRIEARKRRKAAASSAEEIARQIRSDAGSASNSPAPAPDSESLDLNAGGGLALSSTIEFVQRLTAAANANAVSSVAASSQTNTPRDKATDKTKHAAAPINDHTTLQTPHESTIEIPEQIISHEQSIDTLENEEETAIVSNSNVQKNTAPSRKGLVTVSTRREGSTLVQLQDQSKPLESVVDEEPVIGTGLGSVFSLLRKKNIIERMSDEQKTKERNQRDRDQWITAQRRREAELQHERQRIKQIGKDKQPPSSSQTKGKSRRGKPDAMSQRELELEREREQELLDRKWAREYEEMMKDYKPDVKLEYVDETGRSLTTKEAYKQLSHAFHGTYSGKNKVDKIMARRERERKQLALTSADATHQYGAVLESAHKKLGTAGIVLSTGNKTGLSSDILKPKGQ